MPKSKHSASSPPLDVSGGSASASFPYIPLAKDGAQEQPRWTPKVEDTSAKATAPGHARLGSLIGTRSTTSASDLSRVEELVRNIVLRQSSQRGVHITDPFDERAPWRTDDSLVSPELLASYQQYPPFISVMLQYADPALVGQAETDELARYISLVRFGEIENNAWKILKRICGQKKDSRALVWLDGRGDVVRDWTYGDLYSRVCAFSLYIKNVMKLARGDRAILAFVPGLDFFVAFWACLSQGVVAVPVTPVDPFNPRSDVCEKLAAICASCSPAAFITASEYVHAIDAGRAYLDTMKEGAPLSSASKSSAPLPFDIYTTPWTCIESADYSVEFDPRAPFADNVGSGFSLAFLQFTSGSTGNPKGVMVGHANLVANVAGCTEETRAGCDFAHYRRTVAVSWLPTFHDMGLMGFHAAPLLTGTPVVYCSPLDFLAQPLLWLRVLSQWSRHKEYSYVTTGGPPFALDLVCKRLAAVDSETRAELDAELDLSRVLSIILGAEPIRAASLLGFASALAPHGFSSNAFMPAYGLAENVLHVCGKKDNTYPPTLLHVESQALTEGRIAPFDPSPNARVRGPGKWLVSVGELHSKDPNYWPGMRVASGTIVVVDPTTRVECADGTIGELWITGRCVTAGYWNNAAATTHAYSARLTGTATETGAQNVKSSFYRTGDLGCFYQNNLYITGRLKEMIIINGTKHYPMDVEEAIRLSTQAGIASKAPRLPAGVSGSGSAAPRPLLHLRPGGILATEMENSATGKNELVVMVELIEPPRDAARAGGGGASSSTSSSSSSSSGGSSDGAMSSSQVQLANALFKHAQRLPPFMRTHVIKWLARVGARYARYQKEAAANKREQGHADPTYDSDQLDSVEKAVRRAVMGRFGIPVAEVILLKPRSILKTSSGKIRRLATCALLSEGGLVDKIWRRSSEKAATTIGGAKITSAVQWTAKPTVAGADADGAPKSTNVKRAMRTESKKKGAVVVDRPHSSSVARVDSGFELVSTSPTSSTSPSSSGSQQEQSPSPKLEFGATKTRVSAILGEELQLDGETVLMLSQTFSFDPNDASGATLDEYGLDSLTAMKIAGRLTREFDLLIPISPFMFFADPTLDGMVRLIIRLSDERLNGDRIQSAKQFRDKMEANAATKRVKGGVRDGHAEDEKGKVGLKATVAAKKSVAASISDAAPKVQVTSSSSSAPPPHPFILGIGCIVPGPGAPQDAIMDVMVSDMQLPAKKAAMFAKIGESAGIDRRYSVLPTIEAIYFGRKGLGNNESVDHRQSIFKVEAPALSLDSARAAIADWGGDLHDITHVVAVTCTGVIVPGLEFSVLSGLGLSPSTQRLSVTFMGCFGALSGMKAARAFAMESPSHRVLLVCTELCSLHMQLDDRIDNLVGSALFADGSAAMIIGGSPRPGERAIFEMHRNASVIIPDTIDMMAWELTSSGMSIGLGKDIPNQIYQSIDSFAAGLLADTEAHEANFDQCLWAIHPGGPMILSALSDRLGLSPLHTSSAWTVLRQYGNMSSATLIFVLREMVRQFEEGAAAKAAGVTCATMPSEYTPFVPALAFGPGLNVEGCLLKYVGGEAHSDDDREQAETEGQQ